MSNSQNDDLFKCIRGMLLHAENGLIQSMARRDLLFLLVNSLFTVLNDATIKFFQPLYEIQDIGTDDAGIYEMVIEAAVIFQKGKTI